MYFKYSLSLTILNRNTVS